MRTVEEDSVVYMEESRYSVCGERVVLGVCWVEQLCGPSSV